MKGKTDKAVRSSRERKNDVWGAIVKINLLGGLYISL